MRELVLYAQHGDAAFLIERNDDGIFLYSRLSSGSLADTWHQSLNDAKAQANYDANGTVGPWAEVTDALKAELTAKFKLRGLD